MIHDGCRQSRRHAPLSPPRSPRDRTMTSPRSTPAEIERTRSPLHSTPVRRGPTRSREQKVAAVSNGVVAARKNPSPIRPWSSPLGPWSSPLGPWPSPLEPWSSPVRPWSSPNGPWSSPDRRGSSPSARTTASAARTEARIETTRIAIEEARSRPDPAPGRIDRGLLRDGSTRRRPGQPVFYRPRSVLIGKNPDSRRPDLDLFGNGFFFFGPGYERFEKRHKRSARRSSRAGDDLARPGTTASRTRTTLPEKKQPRPERKRPSPERNHLVFHGPGLPRSGTDHDPIAGDPFLAASDLFLARSTASRFARGLFRHGRPRSFPARTAEPPFSTIFASGKTPSRAARTLRRTKRTFRRTKRTLRRTNGPSPAKNNPDRRRSYLLPFGPDP